MDILENKRKVETKYTFRHRKNVVYKPKKARTMQYYIMLYKHTLR